MMLLKVEHFMRRTYPEDDTKFRVLDIILEKTEEKDGVFKVSQGS